MELSRVRTRADLEAYHAVEAAAHAHDRVGLPADPVEEWLPFLAEPDRAGERVELYTDGVGAVCLRFPTLDNPVVVNADATVHPASRGHGHGRRLLAFVLAQAAAAGRSRVFLQVPEQPPAGRHLAESLGFRAVLEDTRRLLDLRERPPAPRAPVPGGYRVVQWLDRAPDELVDGCAYLMGRMTVDAPMGDMDYEQEKWDAARYREQEATAAAAGRRRVSSAAVHASGQVAGITDLGVNRAAPEVGYQWQTIVDPDHRGRGLGLLLKAWNHALLVETVLAVRYLNTWNASSNSHMIRVNDLLGYQPMETWTEYQLDL